MTIGEMLAAAIQHKWIVMFWVSSGILAAGIMVPVFQYGYESPNQRDKDYRDHLGFCLFLGLAGGPLTILVAFFMSGFCKYGWRLTKMKEEIRK